MALLSTGDTGRNYNYSLQSVGATAQSASKDYRLKMLSYKTGELCCEGSYCGSLNKSYPSCSNASVTDECAGQIGCSGENWASCGCKGMGRKYRTCDTSTGQWNNDWGECSISEDCCQGQTSQQRACGCNGTGTQTRTCDSGTGVWSDWGACSVGGCTCAPDEEGTDTRVCGCKNQGTQTRTCDESRGVWNDWGACSIPQECSCPNEGEGELRACGCKNQGYQTRTCNTVTGEWNDDWSTCSVAAECECDPMLKPTESESCGCENKGTQTRSVTCDTSTGEWNEPAFGTCVVAPEEHMCGCNNAGTQTRSCNLSNNTWGEWGTCSVSAGDSCTPGATEEGECTSGTGTQSRTCDESCSWGSWDTSACITEIDCTGNPGSESCGNCGTRTQVCDKTTGTWTYDNVSCSGEGECAKGTTSTQSCEENGLTGSQSRTCSNNCTWGSFGTCETVSACDDDDDPWFRYCGNCNSGWQYQTTVCNESTGQWIAYGDWTTCYNESGCTPGDTDSASCGSGYTGTKTRTCNNSCSWGGWNTDNCVAESTPDPEPEPEPTPECTNGQTAPCPECGIKTCQNGTWGNCVATPASCGKCGTKTCSSSGYWGTCSGEGTCNAGTEDTRACQASGKTGTETRTCSASCSWGSWDTSGCTDSAKECPENSKPSTSQPCGCNNGGTQTRTVTCNTSTGNWNTPGAWSTCSISDTCSCDNSTKPATEEACASGCGKRTRTVTCNTSTGNWNTPSAWSGTCYDKPSASETCGGCGTRTRSVTCNTNNTWSTGSWSGCDMATGTWEDQKGDISIYDCSQTPRYWCSNGASGSGTSLPACNCSTRWVTCTVHTCLGGGVSFEREYECGY